MKLLKRKHLYSDVDFIDTGGSLIIGRVSLRSIPQVGDTVWATIHRHPTTEIGSVRHYETQLVVTSREVDTTTPRHESWTLYVTEKEKA